MVITMGFAGGFTGGYFASRGDPFWTISGGLAGVIGVSAGADVYAPTVAYLLSMLTAVLVVYAGSWIETKMRVDDAVGAVAVHGVAGFLGMLWVGDVRRGLPDRHQQRRVLDRRPADGHGDVPAARLPERLASPRSSSGRRTCCASRREVELEGLDVVEYGTLVYPEMGVIKEQVVEPDGTLVDTASVARSQRPLRPADRDAAEVSLMLTFLISVAIMLAVVGGVRAVGRARAAPAQPPGGGPCPRSLTARRTASPSVDGAQPGRRLGRLHHPGRVRELRRHHDLRPGQHVRRGRASAPPAPTTCSP